MRVSIGHFEIPAHQPRRAAAFFREAFGWSVEPVSWPGAVYHRIRAPHPGEGSAMAPAQAGLIESGALGIEAPLPVVHVEDVGLERALAAVEAAGGRTIGEIVKIARMGRFARFRDSEGNQWGMWEASVEEGG